MATWALVLFSLIELFLLVLVVVFFVRLRKSEALLNQLQAKQAEFLHKLQFNAQLEQELISSFESRQSELLDLDQQLEERSERLKKLIKQAEKFCNSPQFLREIILAGHKEGKSVAALSKATGLSTEEVELIIDQSGD